MQTRRKNPKLIPLVAVTLFFVLLTVPARAHVSAGGNLLTDWHWRSDVISVLLVFGTVYIRGWVRLRKTGGEAKLSQLVFYALALVAIGCALLSPIDDLASYLLIAHMVQHEMLMMLAPPLILLANPVPVLLWGLSGSSRFQPGWFLTRHSVTRRVRDFLGWMPVAWSLYVVNLWAWHHPVLYQAALQNSWIHDFEHILFFLTALVFWWPVIQPVSRPGPIQDGIRILYLFLAATQDTVLSGLIALSSRILYPHYETALRLWDLTPREDQIGGGIVMFAVGSMTYLVAILVLVNVLLGEGRRKGSVKRTSAQRAENIEGRI
ncbi:MAG TPA: cytochrome c oxidase assembly protein [Candidatus Binatia bacterium]|jgi:cytochrome c oxidase assembly factor CtaG|nr:cytochrome c oxidase assembly protein [Candidatus Binatia bacterium]